MTHDPEITSQVIMWYTLIQAVADGALVPVFMDLWPTLSRGKPIMATAAVDAHLSPFTLTLLWDAFVDWQRTIEPTLPEADRRFAIAVHGKTVWVIDDGTAVTMRYPEDDA